MYMYTLYCLWDYQDNKHLEFDSIVSEKPPRDRNIFAFKISNHLKGENIFAIKVHPRKILITFESHKIGVELHGTCTNASIYY